MCRWEAIDEEYCVDPIACEGCGVCVDFCPAAAIDFPLNTCGEWYLSDTRFGPMVHARLGIAEENSGKLVTLVRQEARQLGQANQSALILTDGPPGVGCPVIASIGGADAVLIVTEPSTSGRHDMARVAQLAAHFNVSAMVCVNKFDIDLELTEEIEAYARDRGMMAAGRIPFDPIFVKSMVQAQTVFEYDAGSAAAAAVRDVWWQVAQKIGV
jgi:MinD superfamily P-loop ATPase